MTMRSRAQSRWMVGFVCAAVLSLPATLQAQPTDVASRLQGFDAYMEKILSDWNAPGIGVGIVVGDQLVFAKGYGHRDYGKKLPFTPKTLIPIGSNTKLFTAVAAGLLVEEGKLTWDEPIRQSVPSIQFYNDDLNRSVTLRDMLAHRTGITRHDTIWYLSPDSRKQLFEKIKYLEPKEPLRTLFLYNNMMYCATGYMIELVSGQPWEAFVRNRILKPLEMTHTYYTINEMTKQPDFGVGYTEKRDSFEIYHIPYYEDTPGIAPAGAIISSIEDMSHWLIALMNNGQYKGKQVLPGSVLKETLRPAIALPNTAGETRGYWEIFNSAYGMGRQTASYRGRLLTFHGGDIDGFHAQVSYMPQDKIGVIVFVIGDHCASLYNTVGYNIYERLLGMDQTPWSERILDIRLKGKKAASEMRTTAGSDRVPNTRPSHPIEDYAGEYEDPAYGVMKINRTDTGLAFDYHTMKLPLEHYHYDRFDSPDDERYGLWSINFLTNPQGDVDKVVMSLDEGEVTFVRRPETLSDQLLRQLAGTYETPTGAKFQVIVNENGRLALSYPGQPTDELIPYKGLKFRAPQYADVVFEFVMEKDRVTSFKRRDASGEFTYLRK
ncbi:MAG TPA: serine hydrolase [Candidatus Eisenbacteria bacterium]|nr:serine hydrolase [Candidatus Eisenbacteria bacterium]